MHNFTVSLVLFRSLFKKKNQKTGHVNIQNEASIHVLVNEVKNPDASNNI